MRIKIRLFYLLLLALHFVATLFGLFATANEVYPAETVYYLGPISTERNRRFFVFNRNRPVERLVITSNGGEVEAGIALGEWVFEHQLDVEIEKYCLSSCANYVFPAGRNKFIRAGAVVAWHGNYHHLAATGLWTDDINSRMERTGEGLETAKRRIYEQVERLVKLERDFFRRIGVNHYLCWVGKMPPYNAPDYYFLSTMDMARFGVTRVHTPSGYKSTRVSGFEDDIVYLELRH